MARAHEIGRPSDAPTARQLHELLRSVNSVTIKPNDRDIDTDGTPKHDTAPEQMEGRYVAFKSAGEGKEVEVRHSLGRVPVGFIEVGRSYPSMVVGWPNDQSLNRAWTKDRIFVVTQSPKGSKYRLLLL